MSAIHNLLMAPRRSNGAVNVTWSGSQKCRAYSMRITGANTGSPPELQSVVSADPPSLTMSWGAANNLVIAYGRSDGTITAYPSGYTDNQYTVSALSLCISLCSKNVVTATENPGTFTMTGTANARTIGVRPTSSFPVVAGTNSGSDKPSTNSTSCVAQLPANIVSGDLLLLFVVTDANVSFNTPSGWTLLSPSANTNAVAFYRVADGTEN